MPKQQTNIRLSAHTKRQLRELADKLGLSEGQLVMLAIDRFAVAEGLHVHLLDQNEQPGSDRARDIDVGPESGQHK
jgi:hypothetical protein